MFRKLVFQIWILFGIWVMVFGILYRIRKRKSLLSESAGAVFGFPLIITISRLSFPINNVIRC
jgi:hypothetical protein